MAGSPVHTFPSSFRGLLPYTLSVAMVLLALLLALIVDSTLGLPFFFTFTSAVLVSTWNGGLGPGLFAGGLSVLLSNYYLLAPRGSITLDATDGIRLIWFAGMSVMMTVLHERQRRVREQLEATLQGSPVAIVELDARGIVLSWNRAAEQIFGWTREEVLGRPLPIIPEDRRAEFCAMHRRRIAGEPTCRMELERVRKDGSPVRIGLSTVSLHNARGEINGAIGLIEDLSKLQMGDDVSPGTRLEQWGPEQDRRFRDLLEVSRSGEKMGTFPSEAPRAGLPYQNFLGSNLEVLAHIRGRAIHFQHVDLSELAYSVMEDLRLAYPRSEARFLIEEDLVASGDPGLLQIVLENLLANALKFTRHSRVPLIEFGRTEEGVFVVRDNGAGFDNRVATHLFGIFQRLHSVEEFEGTGLGLATVKRIIERHGGRIWAESEPERGATFFFTLPD